LTRTSAARARGVVEQRLHHLDEPRIVRCIPGTPL
jgi:hypothetical protein